MGTVTSFFDLFANYRPYAGVANVRLEPAEKLTTYAADRIAGGAPAPRTPPHPPAPQTKKEFVEWNPEMLAQRSLEQWEKWRTDLDILGTSQGGLLNPKQLSYSLDAFDALSTGWPWIAAAGVVGLAALLYVGGNIIARR